ncbi:MAG: hypothetical protein IT201_04950 [Thermoleophilia bacterium]|nr:hypothetical protein [Thermoleophilia bacterium]
MIFVTVGTNEAPFDRLLRWLDDLAREEVVVVQHGPSPVRPVGAECVAFMSFPEVVERMREARIVITHAGVGSVMTALLAGRRPIVVPRLRRFGEAVDDHQLAFGRRMAEAGLAILVEEPEELATAVARGGSQIDARLRSDRRLVGELREYLATRLGPAAPGDGAAGQPARKHVYREEGRGEIPSAPRETGSRGGER